MVDYWTPDLSANRLGRQMDAFNSKARFLLLAGARLSGKTWSGLHRLVRHLYDTPNASAAMFAATIKVAKEGGTWSDLHRYTMPEWIAAGIGFNYTSVDSNGQPGWKTVGDTRTPYFSIRNRYGGQSECRLFSLDAARDVASKVKSMSFSCIYFCELMNFDDADEDQIVLQATQLCLRGPGLRYEDRQWIADTNPSKRGPDSWIYKYWYAEPAENYETYCERFKELHADPLPANDWSARMAERQVIEMLPEDNMRLDPRQLSELRNSCLYDPGLFARDVLSKWVWGDGDKSRHFRSFFKPDLHVWGSIEFVNEDDYEVIKPHPGSVELVIGMDPGDNNHAAVIIDRVYQGGQQCFNVLDELESVGKGGSIQEFMKDASQRDAQWVSLEDFSIAFMDIIGAIETDAGRAFNLENCYSDSSALEKYSATGNTFPALEIMAGSKGRLVPIGVPKPDGSKVARVNLVKKLLATGRLRISAQCVGVLRMLRDLKKGAGRLNFIVEDENKHIFDALSYPLIVLCAEEILTQEDRMNVGRRQTGGGVIHL